jgi:anti-anti-sigma factor
MKIKRREIDGVIVAQVEGKLIGGPENSELFQSFIKTALSKGYHRIVVDLGRTPWANSQGIGMLIGARRSVANTGGELVLARIMDRMKGLLTMTRLLIMFKEFETVDAAVDYLSGKHAASV